MNQPIGIFDSGLGGLTVLKSLRTELPQENFIYLGDLARLPYGNKSPEVIQRYAESCVDFLLEEGAKAIVIACNTATALALAKLKQKYRIPILGVIEPAIHSSLKESSTKKVLVLATEATTKSEVYVNRFREISPTIQVETIACPLFVPLAECGWWDHSITVQVIQEYLKKSLLDFDTICLGCTHYPLLLPSFKKAVDSKIRFIESGPSLSQALSLFLKKNLLLNPSLQKGALQFFCTDAISAQFPIIKYLSEEAVSFSLVELK